MATRPPQLVVALCALLAGCGGGSETVSGGRTDWNAVEDLGPAGGGSAALATNPAGDALVLWIRGTQLITRTRSALGAWGSEQTLGEPGVNAQASAATLLADGRAAAILECAGLSASLRRAPNGVWMGPKLATSFTFPTVREVRVSSAGDLLITQMIFVESLGSQVLVAYRNDAAFGDPEWAATPLTFGVSSSYGVFGSALGAQGMALVLWSERLASGHVLRAQRGTALLGFEPAESVTGIAGTPLACAAVVDAQARAVVLVATRANERTRLAAWRWTRALGWHAETILRETSASLAHLRVAADDNGITFASWSEQGASAFDLVGARFEPEGEIWHEATILAPRAQPVIPGQPSGAYHDLAAGADGTAFVLWIQRDAGGAEVRVRRHSPLEGWEAPITLERVDASVGFASPRIRMDASQRAIALWTRIVNLSPALVTASMR